jgi:hypothetical protein
MRENAETADSLVKVNGTAGKRTKILSAKPEIDRSAGGGAVHRHVSETAGNY